jgi:adenylate cyclase
VGEARKLAAILVSDVVGYSRLTGADEDRILARLRALRSDLIDPTIAVHHGRVVKRTGDGAIVEFRSVVDAVNCAIEIQRAMVERNAGVAPDKRIEFRIGIHLGDVVEESDGDLMGDGVNIAARLEGIAKPGGICISDDAFRQVKSRLDLKVSDLGPVPLKNIAEPLRAYSLEVGARPEARSPPPADQAKQRASKRRLASASIAAAIAAVVLLTAVAGWYVLGGRMEKPTQAAHLSMVVLPCANLSGDPAQDYLADSLTDELTTALARIQGTFVIARNTAFTYKGKAVDAKAIGKDLGVRYVLEGSVQPSGSQVRVNAQLIDAESGAHLCADQFDTPRADLLQMQDQIVTPLGRAMEFQLTEVEAARLKRMPPANPDAEDLALQCTAAILKGGIAGQEVEAGFRLCEQALHADPNNVIALTVLSIKYWLPVALGRSADPKGDLQRGDELVSQALALDPSFAHAHVNKAVILSIQGRNDEAITENERAIALAPALLEAYVNMGFDYRNLGQFDKSLEFFDKAIRLSPRDPNPVFWYEGKADSYFALKQYDRAIEWARRSIAISPNSNPIAHGDLIAALALIGHEAEAQEALQRYLALPPSGLRTIVAWKAYRARVTNEHTDPRYLDYWDRLIEGLRKAGLPEE